MSTRRARPLAELNQAVLFEDTAPPAKPKAPERRIFAEPDPYQIRLGATRLDVYLESVGTRASLRLAAALKELDWTDFETAYSSAGAPPYAPRLMCGLVMYGLAKGVSSLRSLEELARTDLGCMWICAGIQPDHSNIGRFVLRHEKQFEGEFFELVTRLALKATGSTAADLAGDGTVVQAAASRYRTLKREALDKKLGEAREDAAKFPHDDDRQSRKRRYEAADSELTKREEAREKQRKPSDTLRVSTTEPEAPVQPLKNKSFAPSYKPSVLANDKRVIVGIAVEPTSETEPLEEMLTQAERIGGRDVEQLRLDAAYLCESVIDIALKREISLLCTPESESGRGAGEFVKARFQYDENRDVYICPARAELGPIRRSKSEGYVQYGTDACGQCALRAACCPKSSRGRTLKRYPVDEPKDALRQVMSQPRAKQEYRQRKAMVEPVFGFLACKMGLRRFRRRGLKGARAEFALFACAYNLTRVVAVRAARVVFFCCRAIWRLTAASVRPPTSLAPHNAC